MKTITGIVILLLLFTQSSNAQEAPDKKMHREEVASRSFAATAKLVNTGDFGFVAGRTIPVYGRNISLTTIPNHITFSDGEVAIVLPYFGVVYNGAGYNHEPGIHYSGKPRNYSVAINDGKRRIRISFDISNGSESHKFVLTVGKNGYATLLLKSSGRSTSSYDGMIRDIAL